MTGKSQKLLQLPEDIIKHILLLLAMTSNGAKDLARVLLVSKGLKELALSKEVLSSIKFGTQFTSRDSFWNSNGIIVKSARSGNQQSYEEIMKRIKEEIDCSHIYLDFSIKVMEDYSAKVDRFLAILYKRTSDELNGIKIIVANTVKRVKLRLISTEAMINAIGRPFFHEKSLLDRFDSLKPKLEKCSTILSLLMEESNNV